LLTGAAGGIGQATAMRLARQGQRCVLIDRDADALQALCAALPPVARGEHVARALDLTDPAQIDALRDALPGDLPALDAVVNNAGMTDPSQLPLVQQTPENWQRLLDLNLHAPARLLRALHGQLRPGARIVNVSSGAGLHAIPWRGAYSPSKAGLIAQSRAAAQVYPAYRFHVLCPGFVETPLVQELIRSGRLHPDRAIAKIPLGRLATPDDMACALAFLAGAESRGLRADPLCVDGGTSVFGGSQPYAPCPHPVMPCDAPLTLTVHGDWTGPLPEPAPAPDGYAAVLDTTVCASPPGQRLAATLAAARRFVHDTPASASLTILLPRDTDDNWEHAGEHAAVRMLIATLACEWGPDARRINAIETGAHVALDALWPVLRFVAGAQAQYVTGQALWMR